MVGVVLGLFFLDLEEFEKGKGSYKGGFEWDLYWRKYKEKLIVKVD